MRKITTKEQGILTKFIKKLFGADRYVIFVFEDTQYGTVSTFTTKDVTAEDLNYVNNTLYNEFKKLEKQEQEDNTLNKLLSRLHTTSVTIQGREHSIQAIFDGVKNMKEDDEKIVIDGYEYTKEEVAKALVGQLHNNS